MADFAPTAEQAAALDKFGSGDRDLVVQAGAGTGKTSTLELLARSTDRRGQYLSFNKAIAMDAQKRMPATVDARTAHSAAMAGWGYRFRHRLDSGRMSSWELARLLKLSPITVTVEGQPKTLQPDRLAGLVHNAVSEFCTSARLTPSGRDVEYIDGIDLPAQDGKRTYANNRIVQAQLEPAIIRCWEDSLDPNGKLRYTHDRYLKAWQLDGPRLACDYLMFDESQDVSPVLAAIAEYQGEHGAQLVYVGDENQAIYEWLGAVDAMAALTNRPGGLTDVAYLTQSFRFGPAIAAMANRVLGALDTKLRLVGHEPIRSRVTAIGSPNCVLTRTNAKAVETVLDAMADGVKAHLVGGAKGVLDFAKAAEELRLTGSTRHAELSCFGSWGEVQDYVERDAMGGELKLLVKLVDDFGADVIIAAMHKMPAERDAQLVVSTAHRAKGREWNWVRLADDFPGTPEGGLSDPELRLLYVAVTRAKLLLDVSRVAYFADPPKPEVLSVVTADGTLFGS